MGEWVVRCVGHVCVSVCVCVHVCIFLILSCNPAPIICLLLAKVHETEVKLTSWMQCVADLRSQYDWLLFFNVPKLLILYHLLRENDNLEAIVHEISFLCSNEQAALESAREAVEVRGAVKGG